MTYNDTIKTNANIVSYLNYLFDFFWPINCPLETVCNLFDFLQPHKFSLILPPATIQRVHIYIINVIIIEALNCR